MSAAAFGVGVYALPEAARLIGMGPQTLHRWLRGYDYQQDGDPRHQEPLWQTQYDTDEEGVLLGFRDLIEARIVNALRKKRIGLPTIRLCIDRARIIVGNERPFSTRQFKTDGKVIFLDITEGVDEPQLIDLKRRQSVFRRIVAPSISDLEFGPEGAERWWLIPGKKSIVADPERSFGQPIIAEHGVGTARVAQAVKAEGSVERVAKLYELKPQLVRDAVWFERQLGLRQAA